MLLFFFHVDSIILRRVVLPLRGLLCLICAFILYSMNFFFGWMKLRCVIAGFSVPQVGMLHMCSVRCCSFFILLHFPAEVVCVRCEVCFVVVYVRSFWVCFEQIDVLFCSMKFRCVIVGAFGVAVFWMHSVATSVAWCSECCAVWVRK